MPTIDHSHTKAQKRAARVRSRVRGTTERPRLTVFCSNQHTYLQVIDDQQGKTLASANELSLVKSKTKVTGTKTQRAQTVVEALIKQLQQNKITKLAFDRGSRRYHGRVKAVAEAVRQAGIQV